MGRASDAEKAERLNRARELLRQVEQLPDAVERLAHDCSISPRQAYRYLEQAQRLKEPVPAGESKLAFTVKLPRSLIQRVRMYALSKDCPSARWSAERCSRCCREGEVVAEPKPIRATHLQLEYRFDRLLPDKLAQAYQVAGAG